MRLIHLVRDPIERMLSEYHYNVVRGLESDRFADRSLLRDHTYEDASRYALQVEQYLERFDPSQMLIVKSEDLRDDRLQTLGRIFTHLGVDSSWQPPNLQEEYNRSSERRPRSVDRGVRKIPGYRVFATIAPSPLRKLKRRLMTIEAPPRPVLSDRARSELEDRLRDDVRRLHRYVGNQFDGRGIA